MTNGQAISAQDLDDVQAFPLLTSEVRQDGLERSSSSGSSGSIGLLAQNALRDVLSIRPTTSDPKSFVAALDNAFTFNNIDGHTEWAWTPHSYAVQADMGAVTGAQASIYSRAKAALDHAVPLLDGLYPLRADADTQDVDAMRAVVRSDMIELVDELGTVGGPRVQRVDSIFASLLGARFTQTDANSQNDPEQVGGLLGTIRERFGLERARVNTIDEEQNLTNYFILVDHIIALQLSWNAQRHYFDGKGSDVFLGTQLVLLSRALGVVAESVHEAEFVMDSVFLGPAERQTTRLRFDRNEQGQTPLTIDELLSWVERFATEEGPRIIRDAGKDGVVALRPTVSTLHTLVRDAWQISLHPSSNPTRGFHTPRVQRAFEELTRHLERTQGLVDQIRRAPGPRILAVDPSEAEQGDVVRLVVDGENFGRGAHVRLNETGSGNHKIFGTQVTVVSDTELKATFDLRSAPPDTDWTVVVINPDGANIALPNALHITSNGSVVPTLPAPRLARFTPSEASNANPGATLLTITGDDFEADAEVLLVSTDDDQVQIAAMMLDTRGVPNTLVAAFELQHQTPGTWWLLVRQAGGETRSAQTFMLFEPQVVVAVASTPLRVQHIQFFRDNERLDRSQVTEEKFTLHVERDIDAIHMTFNKRIDQLETDLVLQHESGQIMPSRMESQRIVAFHADGGTFDDGIYSLFDPMGEVVFSLVLTHD